MRIERLEDIGVILGALRREAGLSQRKLAAQIGCHHTYISHLEASRKVPSLELLFRIVKFLDGDIRIL